MAQWHLYDLSSHQFRRDGVGPASGQKHHGAPGLRGAIGSRGLTAGLLHCRSLAYPVNDRLNARNQETEQHEKKASTEYKGIEI
jgi:hypothetical protein